MSLISPEPTGTAGPAVDAGAPPSGPPRGLLVALAAGAVTAPLANLVPAVLTLPLAAARIDAAGATSLLSLVVAIGSICSLIAFPVMGRLSDRTTSRLGRRRPYLLGGAALTALGGVVTALAAQPATLVGGYVLTSIGFSATFVACTAVIPDHIPAGRRGPASAIVGLALPVGVLFGLFVANLVSPNLTLMILLPAAMGCVGSLVLAIALPDRRITADQRPPFDLWEFLRTFYVAPRSAPNFAWAWWSRLLIFVGVAAIQAYQAFFLIGVLGFTAENVAGAVFLTTLVLTGPSVLVAPIAARASDRIGRRKPFVIGAALIFTVGLVLAASAHTFAAFVVAMAVLGVGQGIYLAVDIALVTHVLPDPANPAKDLGIMNLANTLPLSIIPAVAPAILLIGASVAHPQNFPALFGFGAVAGLVGALLILPIRGTR
ncbi:MFS transporter [Actinomycetospora sp.]|jgi:MFS family permease|uniref:MFS transporter n=1 Tax=Actinomycetospora sp. TaxID=1872135 RepID=UPI002F3E9DC7